MLAVECIREDQGARRWRHALFARALKGDRSYREAPFDLFSVALTRLAQFLSDCTRSEDAVGSGPCL